MHQRYSILLLFLSPSLSFFVGDTRNNPEQCMPLYSLLTFYVSDLLLLILVAEATTGEREHAAIFCGSEAQSSS